MNQKIIKVGNSAAVTIPKQFLQQAGWKAGDKVTIEADQVSESLNIYKANYSQPQASSITPEFLNIVAKINQRYGPALKSLAKK